MQYLKTFENVGDSPIFERQEHLLSIGQEEESAVVGVGKEWTDLPVLRPEDAMAEMHPTLTSPPRYQIFMVPQKLR